ncbi:MAG TPA: hypothetical protein VNA25_17300 [Phycisphaerae bacterium]|nr:hypothetical protein [Phycisphaerae bacterium]
MRATATSLPLTVLLLLGLASSGWAGGLAGRLGEIADPPRPDPTDRPEQPGTGDPADATGAAPKAPPRPRTDVKDQIAKLKAEIARMRKVTPSDVEPVGVEEAEKRVRRLREAMEKARADLTGADRQEAARLARLKSDFDKKWAERAEAIEKGKKPEGMSPLEWARLCDDYYWGRASLEAEFAKAKGRLTKKMDRKLAALEKAVRDAEEHLRLIREKRKLMSDGTRRFMDRMAAWKLHKARLAAAERALKDLAAIQKDVEGAKERRGDPIEAEAIESTGYLLADKLRQLVLRELQLADATPFPSDEQLDKGLPLPKWMTLYGHDERRRARYEYAREQLRLANKALHDLKEEMDAEDRAKLEFLKQLGLSEEELTEEAAKLKKTRAKRQMERAEALGKSIEHWRKEVAAEAAEAERMEKAASRPASAPTGG